MKKNDSIVLFSGLLVILALRAFGAQPSAPDQWGHSIMQLACIALAVSSFATAVALWRGSTYAMKLFVCWALTYLAVGGLGDFITDTPFLEIALWWLVVGAMLLPVGFHLRYVLRQSVHNQV